MVGAQGRSMAYKVRAMKLLAEGAIGKVYMARGICYKRRPSIGRQPDGPAPPGLDWDLFRGPAPMRPFNPNRYKYNWHWFWDTGNGDIGNAGVHDLDLAWWGLGEPSLPKSVVSTGAKYIYDDDQETPNTQLATFDYGDRELVFEVRGLGSGREGGLKRTGSRGELLATGANIQGNLFYGSEGYMELGAGGFQVYRGEKREPGIAESTEEDQYAAAPHFANFLNAARTRDRKYVTADIERGVIAATLCHLANISYRTCRELVFDSSTWQFAGDPEANRLLTREYRAPYVVPELRRAAA
jgi:predicted dehydrogenase